MKITTAFLFFLVIRLSDVHAQTVYATQLDNTGFSIDNDRLNCASLTQGGQIIVAGDVLFTDNVKVWAPAWVSKLDANGTPIWWTGFESYHPDSFTVLGNNLHFFDAMQDASGNYVLSGWLENGKANKNKGDGILLKLNTDGTLKWYKRYHNKNENHLPGMQIMDIAQLPNGNYVGTGLVGAGYDKGGWLWFQTDANGQNANIKIFEHQKRATGIKVIPQSDNSSVVAWNTGTNGSDGDIYPVFSKINSTGTLLSEKWVVLDYNALITDCIQTADGGFAAVGSGVSESFLLKLDASLNVLWVKSYAIGAAAGGDDIYPAFKSVSELSSGNFYITGANYPTLNFQVYENLVVETDGSGNMISARSLSQSSSTKEITNRNVPLTDGRVMLLGDVINVIGGNVSVYHDLNGTTACTSSSLSISTTSNGLLFQKDKPLIAGTTLQILIKKDTLTWNNSYNQITVCPPMRTELTAVNKDLKIYPNPASEMLNIILPDNINEPELELTITGIDGVTRVKKKVSATTLSLNVDEWPAGMYTYQLLGQAGYHANGFFIKE